MAGESQISRLATTPHSVNELRFDPITTEGKSIVTREEMQNFVDQVNRRMQEMHTTINQLVNAVRTK